MFCAALAVVAVGLRWPRCEGRKLHDTRRRDAVSGAVADNDGQQQSGLRKRLTYTDAGPLAPVAAHFAGSAGRSVHDRRTRRVAAGGHDRQARGW